MMRNRFFCIFATMQEKKYDIITILGPTASGKTALAAALAARLDAEVISGDSRQVYRGMDIGTGKDLDDYVVEQKRVPYHLIDIVNAGEKYNVYQFQHDFHEAFDEIKERGHKVVFCGGSGLYLESVLRGYKLLPVPQNAALREALSDKSLDELMYLLSTYKTLHNTTDVDTVKRAIRAIEIEEYYKLHAQEVADFPHLSSLTIGLDLSRDERRRRISRRLDLRLKNGMVEEVKGLLDSGIPAEDLIYYGLEYKFVTLYLTGKMDYAEMYQKLEIAIHQFAKRQMTWFRGMERRGIPIHWLQVDNGIESNLKTICVMLKQ